MRFFEDKNKEQYKRLKQAIKSKDLKGSLTNASLLELNYKQELTLFELFDENNIFEVLNELSQDNTYISDKILALSTLYYSPSYFWSIGVGSNNNTVLDKYPYIARLYEEKIESSDYLRTLFLEWKKLFFKMIKQEAIYKDEQHTAQVYNWAHEYEEFNIEYPAFNMTKILFNQAKKEELFEIILNCKNYPKIPHATKEIDKRYNEQNSRYYDLQCFSTWLSESVLPLLNNSKEEKASKKIPLVSQGLMQEINLIYNDLIIDKNLLEPQDSLILEKLYQQRLPELLTEYEKFDHNNYANLTHKNKNADELLFTSLSQIYTMFEQFNEKVNVKKLENLSFHMRLTKEFIKHNF